MFKICFAIPAKNEELRVGHAINDVIDIINRKNLKAEIIIINDGSTDRTREVIEQVVSDSPFKNIQVIDKEINEGIGSAFWSAVNLCNSEYIVIHPGDNENNSTYIDNLLFDSNGIDFFIGVVNDTTSRKYFRRKISKVYTAVINLSFGQKIKYYNGTSIYRVQYLKKIEPHCFGFFFSAEVILKLIKMGARSKEIEISLNTRPQKKSSALTLNSLVSVCHDYIYMLSYWYG